MGRHKDRSIFVIDNTPYCLWDPNPRELNLRFLEQIDHEFFDYLADVHGNQLDGKNKLRAGSALRFAYFHGLETFFSLICASLQSPHCAVGWMLKYHNHQLRKIISSISNNQLDFEIVLKVQKPLWLSIATLVHKNMNMEPTEKVKFSEHFATLWRRFAEIFLDPKSVFEYNSLKHGLRATAGGFDLLVGSEDIPGVSPPPERMRSLGPVEFAHHFHIAETIPNSGGDSNFDVSINSISWTPRQLSYSLELIASSIKNVISFIKILNRVPMDKVSFDLPADFKTFDEPFADSPSIVSFSMKVETDPKTIHPYTKEELRDIIKRAKSRT